MDCFGTYLTHAQTCDDNVRVQNATQRTAAALYILKYLNLLRIKTGCMHHRSEKKMQIYSSQS